MAQERDNGIDIFKGLLVTGMVYAHVLQFFCDFGLYPGARSVSDFINVITFSGFVFSFGYVSQIAYYSKPFKAVYHKMLITALKTLGAFYISGLYFRLFMDSRTLDWSLIKPIVLLEDIPGWSEFLVSFSLIMLVGFFLFQALGRLVERKPVFWVVAAGLLLTTFIDYGSVASIHLGLLVGTDRFTAFPVLQYFPFYLIGNYFARHGVFWDWRVLVGAGAASGLFIGYLLIHGSLPSRFPPSVFWILSPCLFLYGYYLLSKYLGCRKIYTGFLQVMGRNVLFYLLLSNIIIFTLKKNQHFLQFSTVGGFWFAIALLLVISFLLQITSPQKVKRAQNFGV